MSYTIGEVAAKLNIAPSTLRYYDKEGLLPFVERTEGGIRQFKDSDLEALHLIECLKQTGMAIKDIKIFMEWSMEGDSTIEKRLEFIDRQREKMLQRIAEMEEALKVLDYKHWYYETAKEAGTCSVHEQ